MQSTDVIQVSKKWLKQPIEASLSEKLPNKLSKQQKNSHKKETVEKTQNSETVEHTEPEPSAETVETVKNDVDNYDVTEESLDDSSIDERQTFQTPNIGQEAPTANFQEQINPIQDTTNKPLNSFAEQAHASFPQTNSTS